MRIVDVGTRQDAGAIRGVDDGNTGELTKEKTDASLALSVAAVSGGEDAQVPLRDELSSCHARTLQTSFWLIPVPHR